MPAASNNTILQDRAHISFENANCTPATTASWEAGASKQKTWQSAHWREWRRRPDQSIHSRASVQLVTLTSRVSAPGLAGRDVLQPGCCNLYLQGPTCCVAAPHLQKPDCDSLACCLPIPYCLNARGQQLADLWYGSLSWIELTGRPSRETQAATALLIVTELTTNSRMARFSSVNLKLQIRAWSSSPCRREGLYLQTAQRRSSCVPAVQLLQPGGATGSGAAGTSVFGLQQEDAPALVGPGRVKGCRRASTSAFQTFPSAK